MNEEEAYLMNIQHTLFEIKEYLRKAEEASVDTQKKYTQVLMNNVALAASDTVDTKVIDSRDRDYMRVFIVASFNAAAAAGLKVGLYHTGAVVTEQIMMPADAGAVVSDISDPIDISNLSGLVIRITNRDPYECIIKMIKVYLYNKK